ncbi:MAG TPA: TetR/AcrR family transcriptional regulator [Solirubrobacteraceae bacterium]|nr:TetR/AcrR family transcriptional regulator [Solirubrobacteraceae bacterium]
MPTRDDEPAAELEANDRGGRRGPRPRGAIRAALVEAGVALARAGGPDAVVLREVTRTVGVVPNAAYRHFADRDALLAAVSDEAVGQLARRMAARMGEVRPGPHTPTGARLRLRAVGQAYLEFARTEPGLFDTAFAASDRHLPAAGAGEPSPLDHLQSALDNLVAAGLLSPARRQGIEYPTWATVHGLAVLLRGPLSSLTDGEKTRLEAQTLAFIGASVS